ncbi:helix-turn-helix transcriptional regulator [Salibaculum griseiflavum]|uniref:AraC family transcriptional regulator n=1 Tax=Salibaculum griseiflavum TaxID=1914409 RepID=A0A2V1P6H2_9RHOB|nr:AraC family transcriptional regulator [Salibaculum griseiflavum]PWG18101.1 AraC family transcriptional regulator [Salibaculum griseiflavum]
MLSDRADRLALYAFGQNSPESRWRTEAMRSHASARLVFVAKGQGRITVAGLTSGYGPNNLIFIPGRTMYGFEAGTTVFGQILTIPPAMTPEWPEDSYHLRLRDVAAQKDLATHFDHLERELQSPLPGAERAALHHLGLLSVFFERQLALREDESTDKRQESASARLVAAYTDLIERDFQDHKGVADYAAALGVTPTHLTRCCKQTCSKSALDLLNDRILYEARVLLRDSDIPVRDIARDLGFGSAAYFTRAFQNRTGMTPSAFRKMGPLHAA